MRSPLPNSQYTARRARRRARLLAVVVACLGILGAYTVANGAANGDGTMTVAQTSVAANSAGNTFVFTFTNTATSAFSNGSTVTVDVPTGWTAPSTSAGAGQVTVANVGSGGCIGSNPLSLTGATSRTISIKQTCGIGGSFTLTYASVVAPTDGTTYTFLTKSANGNVAATAIASSPTITTTLETSAPTIAWECSAIGATGPWEACPASGWTTYPSYWIRASVSDGTSGSGLATTLSGTDSQVPAGTDLVTASSTCENATTLASGPKSCVFIWARTTDTTSGGVTYTITGAADRQGNVAATSSYNLKLDKTAPTAPGVTCSDTGACTGWSASASVVLTASGSTDTGGSGLADYESRASFEGGAWSDWAIGTSREVSAEGRTVVQFRTLDVAGNPSATTERTVSLDRSLPAIAWSCSTTSATTGYDPTCLPWYRQTVWVRALVTDAGSGFTAAITTGGTQSPGGTDATTVTGGCLSASTGTTSCSFVWRRTADTTSGGVTYAVTATDRVGQSRSDSQRIWFDQVAPATSWTYPTGAIRLSNPSATTEVFPDWTSSDLVSGVASSTATLQRAATCDAVSWATVPGQTGIASGSSVTLDEGACYRFVVTATDTAANAADSTSGTIRYPTGGDSTPPTGTVTVNAGAEATNGTTVRLTLSATDVGAAGLYQMRFSSDGTNFGAWQAYATSATFTLSGVDGTKTVWAQFSDTNDNISEPTSDTIVLDRVAPSGTVVINGGNDYTNGTGVSLTLSASDALSGVTQMKVRNLLGGSADTWVPYATAADWTIAASDGTRTVYVQYQDAAGNLSTEVLDTVVLDRAAPTITFRCGTLNLSNNSLSGPAVCPATAWLSTSNLGVQATVTDAAPAAGFTAAISSAAARGSSTEFHAPSSTCDEASAGSTSCTYTFLRQVDTTAGGVTYTVSVADRAGNATSLSQTVRRDTTAPVLTGYTINNGDPYTTSATVTLGLSASDGGSGVATMQFSLDNSTWSTAEAFAATKSYTLAAGDGPRTVWARAVDAVLNPSVAVSRSIVLDSSAPAIAWTCATTAAPVTGDWATCSGTWYANATVWARAVVSDGGTGLAATIAAEGSRTSADLDLTASTCDDATAGTTSCAYVWKRQADTTSGGAVYTVGATDVAGYVTAPTSQTVLRDATAPTGTVVINANATATNGTTVTLTIAASDGTGSGPSQMRIAAASADLATAQWVTYATTAQLALTSGADGLRSAFVQFRDVAQNISATASDTILLDRNAPTVTYTCATSIDAPLTWGSCGSVSWYNTATVWVRATVADANAGFGVLPTGTATDLRADLSSCDDGTSVGGTACEFVWARTTDTTGQAYTVSATDAAGNAGSGSQTIRRDTIAPVNPSVVINDDTTYTPATLVTLRLSASDATGYSGIASYRVSNDGNSWQEFPFVDTTTWTLTAGDGTKTVSVSFKDVAGNTTNIVTDSIVMDATPPTASVTIESGAAYTTSTGVSLAITASDGEGTGVREMRVSGNGGATWTAWAPFAGTALTTLTTGDGVKTVRVEVKDLAGAIGSASDTIILDQAGPSTSWSCSTTSATAGDFAACGTWYKSTVWVKATVTDPETGVGAAMASAGTQSPTGTDLLGAPSSTCKSVPAGTTSCTLVWARTSDTTSGGVTYSVVATDAAGNSSGASIQNVKRDTVAPSGVSMIVAGGATSISTGTVALTIGAGDGAPGAGSGVSTMRLRNEALAWSASQAFTTSVASWSLSPTDGTKTVSVEVADLAGNVTVASDTILLDTTAPSGTFSVNNGVDFTTSTSVSLGLALTDGTGSGSMQMRFRNDGSSWTGWEAYAARRAWTIPGEGTWTVWAEVRDALGNTVSLSDGITYARGSTIVFACAGGAAPTDADFTDCYAGWNDGTPLTIRAVVTSPFAGLATATRTGASQSPVGTDLSTGESTCDEVVAGATSCTWVWKRTTDTTVSGVVYSVTVTDLAGNTNSASSIALKRDGTPVAVAWACAVKNGANQNPTNNDWGACPTTWYGGGYVFVRATVSDTLSGLNSGVVNGYAQTGGGSDLVGGSSTCQTFTSGASCTFVWKRALDTTSGGVAYLVTAPDTAGNAGTARQTIQKDTTAPTVSSWLCATTPEPTTGDFAACPATGWLGGTTVTVRATLTDNGSGFGPTGSTATATDLSAAYSTCDDITSGTAGVTSCTFAWRRSADTPSGGVVYQVTPVDRMPLTGTASSQTIRRDGVAPTIAWECSTTSATSGFAACSTAGYQTTVWVRAIVTDATAGLAASVAAAQSEPGSDLVAASSTCSTIAAGATSCQVVWARTADTTSGGITYSIAAADTAGNQASGSQNVLKGRFGPEVAWTCATAPSATSGDYGACGTGWYSVDGLWVKAAVSDTGTGISATSTSASPDLVGDQSTCQAISGTASACEWVWYHAGGTLNGGITYTVTAVDTLGRQNVSSTTVKVDTTAPIAGTIVRSPAVDATSATTTNVDVTGASDPESAVAARILHRTSYPLVDGVCGAAASTVDIPAGSQTLTTGACYTWSATVTNGAGLTATTAESTPLKVDATPPAAPAAPSTDRVGMTSATSVIVTAGAPGTDGESGVAGTQLYLRTAPFANVACGTYGAGTPVAAGSVTLATGTCTVFYAITTNGTGLATASVDSAPIMVDTTAPTAPGTPVLGTSATLLGTTDIPVSLGTLGSDPESGATTTLRRESSPLSLGICGASFTLDAESDPIVSGRCYRFFAMTTNGAGLTAVSGTTGLVAIDATGPIAPAAPVLSAIDSTTATTLTITAWSAGTDPETGVMVSALYRKAAPLAGGVCGTFDAGTVFSTDAAPVQDVVTSGYCYQYFVRTINNATVTADSLPSGPLKVDASGALVTATTTTPSDYTTGGAVSIVAGTAADPESGLVSTVLMRKVAFLSGGSCLAYGSPIALTGSTDAVSHGFCYVYFVRATNGIGTVVDGPASTPVKVDATAPTGAPGAPVTTPTDLTASTNVSLATTTPGADAESGIASYVFYRKIAPLTGGACGTYGAAVAVAGTTDTDPAAGCRVYYAVAKNGSGLGIAGPDSAPVKIDTTAPTAASAPTTTPTGPTSLTTISIVPGAAGTDAESGVLSTQLWRTSAALLSGVCQAYGNDVTAATTETVMGGACYRYYLKTTNRVGLVSTGALSAPVLVASQTPVVVLDLSTATDSGTPGDRITNATSLLFTVVFDRAVTDVTPSDFTASGTGCVVAEVTGSGTTYGVSVTGCAAGSVTLTVAANAALGVASPDRGPIAATSSPAVTIDRTAPSVASFTTPATSLSDATSIVYSLVFSEPVTGLAVGDLSLAGSTSTGWTIASASGSGTTYAVTLTGTSPTVGTIALGLAAGSVADVAGTAGPTAAATAPAVTYAPTYVVTATAGANGSISPSGTVMVAAGASQVFTITPATGYRVATITVDGAPVSLDAGGTTYTLTNVTGPRAVAVTFTRVTWTITATAGTGGTITPSGAVAVLDGDPVTFTITPATGYHVLEVFVDSTSIGAVTTYTFPSVTANRSIGATFAADAQPAVPTTTTIVASASTILLGETVTLTATISPSSAIGSVTFWDGSSPAGTCTIASGGSCSIPVTPTVAGAHTFNATFNGNSAYTMSTSTSAAVVTVGNSSGGTSSYPVPVSAGQLVPVATAEGPTVSFTAATDGTAVVTVSTIPSPTATGSTPFTTSGGTVVYDISVAMSDGTTAATSYTICLPGSSPQRLWHYENGAWVDITTGYGAGTICGTTTSFSPFAVGAPKPATPPVVTLTLGATSITAGSPVTLFASVAPSAATGTIVFRSGATTLGSCALTSGACSTSATPSAGSYTVVAEYSGDGSYFGAASTSSELTVQAATSGGGGGGGFGGIVPSVPALPTVGTKPQSLAFTPVTTLYVGGKVTLAATAESGGPVTYDTTTQTVCSITVTTAGPVLTGLAVGTCRVTATQAGDPTWAAAAETRSITVTSGAAATTALRTRAYIGTTLLTSNPAKVAAGKLVVLRVTTSTRYAGRSVGIWRRLGTTGTWKLMTTKKIGSDGRVKYGFTVTRSDVTYRFILKTSTTTIKGTAIRVIRK